MIILGYDPPGGWALLDFADKRFRFIDCGTVEGVEQDWAPLTRADLVCIEQPAEIFANNRTTKGNRGIMFAIAGQLLSTRDAATRLATLAEVRGAAVVQMTSAKARRALSIRIGGRGATKGAVDKQIAVAVPRLVAGWPERSNTHVRDAAVVAIAGSMKWRMSASA